MSKTAEHARALVADDKACDICHNGLKRFDTFYNAKTASGQWGWLCRRCWQYYGKGLGTGLGQEYNSRDNVKLRG